MQITFTSPDGTTQVKHGTVTDAVSMADSGVAITRIDANGQQYEQLVEQLGPAFCKKVAG